MIEKVQTLDIAKKCILLGCSDVNEICNPIFQHLNVHGFSFHRLYENGERLFLSNSHAWVENYFLKNYFLVQNYEKYSSYDPYILWSNWPKEDSLAFQVFRDAHTQFNYGESISIHKKNQGYIDIFSLRSINGNRDINSNFLNSFEPINKFLDEFLTKANLLIKLCEHVKIPNPFQEKEDLFKNNSNSTEVSIFHPVTRRSILTEKELLCLKLFVRGNTIKAAAQRLNLSPRTVETHLENIKLKLGLKYKSELIQTMLENQNYRSLLLPDL